MGEARTEILESVAKLDGAVFTITETRDLSPQIVAINYFGMEEENGAPLTAVLRGTWSNDGLPNEFRVSFKAMGRVSGKAIYICSPVASTPSLEFVDIKLEYDIYSHQIKGRCIWPFELERHVCFAS